MNAQSICIECRAYAAACARAYASLRSANARHEFYAAAARMFIVSYNPPSRDIPKHSKCVSVGMLLPAHSTVLDRSKLPNTRRALFPIMGHEHGGDLQATHLVLWFTAPQKDSTHENRYFTTLCKSPDECLHLASQELQVSYIRPTTFATGT